MFINHRFALAKVLISRCIQLSEGMNNWGELNDFKVCIILYIENWLHRNACLTKTCYVTQTVVCVCVCVSDCSCLYSNPLHGAACQHDQSRRFIFAGALFFVQLP